MAAISINSEQLQRVLRILPVVATTILVVLLASAIAELTWQVLAPAPEYIPTAETDHAAGPRKKRPDYGSRVASLHLFGAANAPATVERRPDETAPETRLNLTLRGVFSTGGEDALAIVSSQGGDEQFYKVGDNVQGGAILKAVYPNRIIIERGSRRETLTLPKGKDTGIDIRRSEATPTRAPASPQTPGASANLGGLRKDLMTNPGKLGKLIQAVPANENGQFVGYRISPRGDPRLFRSLGLESGDIIIAVNDVQIDRPEKGMAALQKLMKDNELTLTLMRDGAEFTVHHSIPQ
ncbi:MAG: type II secretion system protein GspC [Pseudomonadota bacterium]|nr:type II secretion system protein GspC [Pseudomonadota bacterium]